MTKEELNNWKYYFYGGLFGFAIGFFLAISLVTPYCV